MKLPIHRLTSLFIQHLPLLIVIGIGLFVSFKSITPGTHYAGWDNILAEFDLPDYARQVLFGAWSEHQSLGAPSAQGQLSEIPRLPILFLLNLLLPPEMIRYVFIFAMYVIGGIGMYFYLSQYWISEKLGGIRNWLAGLGGIFYLLHVLTLQQFYIAFEMFMVQFAFFPFLMIIVHHLVIYTPPRNTTRLQRFIQPLTNLKQQLSQRFSRKNTSQTTVQVSKLSWETLMLLFLVLQLLIASSGHTPTVFYLAVLFSQLYAFFIVLPQGLWKAVKAGFVIGLLTLLFNAYWIVPNLYYSIHDSRYVQQSHDNRLFGPESVWSIREAGNISNFLKNTHYLLTWKDFSFEHHQFDFIFNEWQSHLNSPFVSFWLHIFGLITIVGFFFALFDHSKGSKRWAIIFFYLGCVSFIWIDLFPTFFIFDFLYQSGSFLEAFRNPFTKLSILYSFAVILFFVQFFETILKTFKPLDKNNKLWNFFSGLIVIFVMSTIIYTAWPSFQGNFISEKLKPTFPTQYAEMFSYLHTRDRDLRVLQLPQLSHAGWEYYDWQFLGKGNGYQGMGFYFFGMPQAFLNRDSDRWIETSDFFYHELKHALDTNDVDQFVDITQKYQVDLVIVDETKIEPHRTHDYARDHLLLTYSGFNQVWQKDFLTIYERANQEKDSSFFVPSEISKVAHNSQRIRQDPAFQQQQDYLLTNQKDASVLYPFSSLLAPEIQNVTISETVVEVSQQIPTGNFQLTVPGIQEPEYFTPVAISYLDNVVSIRFPELQLVHQQTRIPFPTLEDLSISIENAPEQIVLFFNNKGVVLEKGKTSYPVIPFAVGQPVLLEYSPQTTGYTFTDIGLIDGSSLSVVPVYTYYPDWQRLQTVRTISLEGDSELKALYHFPRTTIDILQNPSVNCSTPQQGNIFRRVRGESVRFHANRYGVNCNGYGFSDVSPAFPYIINFQGSNLKGRGIKVFINYTDPHVLPDDYLLHQPNFNRFITVPSVSETNNSTFYLNWEIRSFGKESINELKKIQVVPYPLDQVAQITLKNMSSPSQLQQPNTLTLQHHLSFFDSMHIVDTSCRDSACVFALDQSYDDLWIAFDKNSGQILPHFRFNNWANAWEISNSVSQVIVIYIPELFAIFSLNILIVCAIIRSVLLFINYYAKKRNSF